MYNKKNEDKATTVVASILAGIFVLFGLAWIGLLGWGVVSLVLWLTSK